MEKHHKLVVHYLKEIDKAVQGLENLLGTLHPTHAAHVVVQIIKLQALVEESKPQKG